jgi:DNA-binding XRE family transcriptional regulator
MSSSGVVRRRASQPQIRGPIKGLLQELRLKRGQTQAQLGAEVGTTGQAIKQWESGRALPSLESALRLERVLGVPLRELFQLEDADDGGA